MWWQMVTRSRVRPIDQSEPRYLGEYNGLRERELKSRLSTFFRENSSASMAYLVRVQYGGEGPVHMALCLRSSSDLHQELVEMIQIIFSTLFGNGEFLDIIFLDDDQEPRLANTCKPFFSSSVDK